MLLSNNSRKFIMNKEKKIEKLKEYLSFFLAAYCWIGVLLAFGYSESFPWFLAAVPWTIITLRNFKDSE